MNNLLLYKCQSVIYTNANLSYKSEYNNIQWKSHKYSNVFIPENKLLLYRISVCNFPVFLFEGEMGEHQIRIPVDLMGDFSLVVYY